MVELQTASNKLAEMFNVNGALAGPPSMLDFI